MKDFDITQSDNQLIEDAIEAIQILQELIEDAIKEDPIETIQILQEELNRAKEE